MMHNGVAQNKIRKWCMHYGVAQNTIRKWCMMHYWVAQKYNKNVVYALWGGAKIQ